MKERVSMKAIGQFILIAIASTVTGQLAVASGLPRFKFTPGEELVYSGSSDFVYSNKSSHFDKTGAFQDSDTTHFWVTGQNGDGSWHLIFIGRNKNARTGDFASTNSTISFGHFDLSDDGQRVDKPATVSEQRVYPAFFPLPADAGQAQSGWSFAQGPGVEVTCRIKQSAHPCIIESTERGIYYEIYQIGASNTIYFNDKLGLVVKIQSQNEQGYGFTGHGTGVVELKSHSIRNQEWMRQFISDAEAVEHAEAASQGALDSVEKGTVKTDTARATARQALESALAHVHYNLLRDKINSDLGNLDEEFRYARQENNQKDSILNKPAPAWVTTDLAGHKHALEDYRGKVVALDFWYRGCGWCMVAMPQIKALVDEFRGQPVVVLGMNTDRKDKDAEFVVNKMQLNYLTLHADHIPEKYGVRGYPTFIVIDQKGIVRAQHVGYSPNLRQEMAKSISSLLSQNP